MITPELTPDDKALLFRALARHARASRAAILKCAGRLWPVLYEREAEACHDLYRKLTRGEELPPDDKEGV